MLSRADEMALEALDKELNDLQTSVLDTGRLIQNHRTNLNETTRPDEIARAENQIETLKKRRSQYEHERSELAQKYDDLSKKLQPVQPSIGSVVDTDGGIAKLDEIFNKLDQVEDQIEDLSDDVSNNHQELLQSISKHYAGFDENQQITIMKVTQKLQENEVTSVAKVLRAIDSNQISHQEMEQIVEESQRALTILEGRKEVVLPVEQKQVADIVKDSSTSFQNKLKFSIPLIPLILNYEAEIGLDATVNLKRVWESLKKKFRKEQ